MKTKQTVRFIVTGLAALGFMGAAGNTTAATNDTALMVVAHGSRESAWNDRVIKAVERLEWNGPSGVAFLSGHPPENTLSNVAARLDQSTVRQIVVVPLLISSYSGHYEEIRFYTGQREDMPDIGHHGHGDLHDHDAAALKTKATMLLTPAMDGHALLTRVLADELKTLSRDATNETIVLVAHGPNEDSENDRWMEHLQTHTRRLREQFGFRRAEAVTLRDDAPAEVRDAATKRLRDFVQTGSSDSRVLVLPVLVSVGHMQKEIRARLDGLNYEMVDGGVANHPLAMEWVREQARSAVQSQVAAK